MIPSKNVIKKLIDRYDYGGAFQVLIEKGMDNADCTKIVNSCRCAVNFDFKNANMVLEELSADVEQSKIIVQMRRELVKLEEGHIEIMFSELLENIKFQIVNEEYIDFLGRVYRFREAIYKYIFVRHHYKQRKFSFHERYMQRKEILRILRKHYKIKSSSLIIGINIYISKYMKKEYKFKNAISVIDSPRMDNLIKLRNSSLVGHGFKGVSLAEIEGHYGDPYAVLDDFDRCLRYLDIDISRFKYSKINEYIFELIEREYEESNN